MAIRLLGPLGNNQIRSSQRIGRLVRAMAGLTDPTSDHVGLRSPKSKVTSSEGNSPTVDRVYGKVPTLLYGTAWKKERTEELVYQALKAGFRGIDTAAQPRHYDEKLVGQGIKRAIQEGIVTREEIYIQTKFTPPSGQDPKNLPYDPSRPISDQINASVASSLENFKFSDAQEPYIDCLVLHSPLRTLPDTDHAWKILESCTAMPNNPIRSLGISNVDLNTLTYLIDEMNLKPSVVQNRFYAETGYEVPIRELCRENGIVFECFWTLTANPRLFKSGIVKDVARNIQELGYGKEDAMSVAVYALVLGLEGVSILNGTTKRERMETDLEALRRVEELARGGWKEKWEGWMKEFRDTIGE